MKQQTFHSEVQVNSQGQVFLRDEKGEPLRLGKKWKRGDKVEVIVKYLGKAKA